MKGKREEVSQRSNQSFGKPTNLSQEFHNDALVFQLLARVAQAHMDLSIQKVWATCKPVRAPKMECTHKHAHAHTRTRTHTHNQHIHTQHIHTQHTQHNTYKQHTQHNTDTPHNTVLLTDFARNCFAIIVQWLLLNLAILQLHRQLLPVLCTIQLNLDVGRLAKPEKVLGTKQTTPQTDTNQTKSIHSHQPQRSSASINHTPVLLQDQVSFFSHSP